jgi:hypothetical protein
MTQPIHNLPELQTLYRANQERMMAYDQAGNAARDQRLKDFFYEKAGQSELAAQAISEVLQPDESAARAGSYVLPGTKLFEKAVYQKPATFLITCAKQLEAAIAGLYNQILSELSALPDSVRTVIKLQQEQIRQSKQEIAQL